MRRITSFVPEQLDQQIFEHFALVAVEVTHDAQEDIFARFLQALDFASAGGSQRECDGAFVDTRPLLDEAYIDQAGYGAHSRRMRQRDGIAQ